MKLTRLFIVLAALAVPTLALAADHAVTHACPFGCPSWCPFC